MVDEVVKTQHKTFRFPTPQEIYKVEIEISDGQLANLTDFFWVANGKQMASGYQIGISDSSKQSSETST